MEGYGYHYPKSFYKEITTFSDHYNYYIPWFDYPDLLLVNFENLIGPKGGGSLEVQRGEIRRIAEFIGMDVSEQKIQYVCKNLWTTKALSTPPQIGLWKEYFTSEHVQKFNAVGMKDISKLLGYDLES